MSAPTPRGVWPTCTRHPDEPLHWHPDGHGWRCTTCRLADQPTPQPWQPGIGGKGTATISPKGRARPNPSTRGRTA